jgi:ATP-binding cassette, subfamily C, bacterial CydC
MRELVKIAMAVRSQWGWMAAGILLGVAVIAANSLLMAVSGWFIASMAVAGVTKVSFNYFVPSAAIRALAISRTIGRYLERLVTHGAAFRALSELRLWLFLRLAPLSPALLERYSSGDLSGRLRNDIDSLETLYLRIIAPLLTGAISMIAATIFVAIWSRSASFALCSSLVVSGLLLPLVVRRLSEAHGRESAASAGELRSIVTEGITGGAELILLGAVEKHAEQVVAVSTRLVRSQEKLASAGALAASGAILSAAAGLAAVLIAGSASVIQGEITGPQLVMLLLFSAAVFEAAGGMPSALQMLPSAMESARRITELSEAAPPVPEPLTPLELPSDTFISFRDVSFAYDRSAPVLSGFNLDLPRGAKVALTGRSGSGKSTLAQILLRFRTYEGSVTIGGAELAMLPAEELRTLISAVPQHPHIFNTTIRENITVSRPSASQEEISSAVYDAVLDEWLSRLPEGLDTMVGEMGSAVSGGEARRIAVARALLQQAEIFILDEPTEGLDADTERKLLERVAKRMEGKTLLMISHRPAAAEIVDTVVTIG